MKHIESNHSDNINKKSSNQYKLVTKQHKKRQNSSSPIKQAPDLLVRCEVLTKHDNVAVVGGHDDAVEVAAVEGLGDVGVAIFALLGVTQATVVGVLTLA